MEKVDVSKIKVKNVIEEITTVLVPTSIYNTTPFRKMKQGEHFMFLRKMYTFLDVNEYPYMNGIKELWCEEIQEPELVFFDADNNVKWEGEEK